MRTMQILHREADCGYYYSAKVTWSFSYRSCNVKTWSTVSRRFYGDFRQSQASERVYRVLERPEVELTLFVA